MNKEKNMTPEAFFGELAFIKPRIQDAMVKTGLTSSLELCHQINWAITLRLKQASGMDIGNIDELSHQKADPYNPKIYYVHHGAIQRTKSQSQKGWYPHSFLLVSGIEQEVLLIDGANDQTDPASPFLVARVGIGLNREKIIAKSHDTHTVEEDIFKSIINSNAKSIPNVLEILRKNKLISDDDCRIALEQYQVEYAAGVDYLMFGFNRDWIYYFARALGVDYSSTQKVQDAYWATEGRNKPTDESTEFLNNLVKKLLER